MQQTLATAKCSAKLTTAQKEINSRPSAQSSARENFFQKKYTHAGSLVNTTLPVLYIYHFTLHILKPSAQNYQNAEDTALLHIIEDSLSRQDVDGRESCWK